MPNQTVYNIYQGAILKHSQVKNMLACNLIIDCVPACCCFDIVLLLPSTHTIAFFAGHKPELRQSYSIVSSDFWLFYINMNDIRTCKCMSSEREGRSIL